MILDAIGYRKASCKVKSNVVLEAEMVAYSEALHRIDGAYLLPIRQGFSL